MPRFKILAGKHREDGVTYVKGQTFDSKSDLTKLNQPGAVKFERVFDDAHRPQKTAKQAALDEQRVEKAARAAAQAEIAAQAAQASLPTVPQTSSVFPGGQVSAGKQQTTSNYAGESVSGPVPPADEGDEDEVSDDLDGLTVAELKEIAEEEEIEVRHGARKDEYVKAIRSARSGD